MMENKKARHAPHQNKLEDEILQKPWTSLSFEKHLTFTKKYEIGFLTNANEIAQNNNAQKCHPKFQGQKGENTKRS